MEERAPDPNQKDSDSSERPSWTVSVKFLVEWVHRTGDLIGEGHFKSPQRALQGIRAHEEVRRARPAGYRSEVPVHTSIDASHYRLSINGRLDGLYEEKGAWILEEIKSTFQIFQGEPAPVHLAQAKIYAHLLHCMDHVRVQWIQITYVHLVDNKTTIFRKPVDADEISDFFNQTVQEFTTWMTSDFHFIQKRNQSIRSLKFPFNLYRPGQRQLAVSVYKNIRNSERMMVQAPTGIGKTMGVLFPALKAMAQGLTDKIIYLTAKVITRKVVEENISMCVAGGLKLRALTLSTRERLCALDSSTVCEPQLCARTKGFFDRFKPALRQLLEHPIITPEAVGQLAQTHSICPYGLTSEAIQWADLIIGDYNHAFDPFGSIAISDPSLEKRAVLVIDEAHNLVDRARAMYGPILEAKPFMKLSVDLSDALRPLKKRCRKLAELIRKASRSQDEKGTELPVDFYSLTGEFLGLSESWLIQNQPHEANQDLQDAYFKAHRFIQLREWLGKSGDLSADESDGGRLILSCLDTGPLLKASLEDFASTIWFSATLSPMTFYNDLLAGGTCHRYINLPYPFPKDNLTVRLDGRFNLNYKNRSTVSKKVSQAIADFIRENPGNHLVFFSSFDYLSQVSTQPALIDLKESFDLILQVRDMNTAAKEAFLDGFRRKTGVHRVGFAVMGGVFSEGIDLPGDALSAVTVVGVGLPQVSRIKNREMEHFNSMGKNGFDYAYRIPGINRVIQAAGRLIRSEKDTGKLLLLDQRFQESKNRALLPAWWILNHTPGADIRSSTQLPSRRTNRPNPT